MLSNESAKQKRGGNYTRRLLFKEYELKDHLGNVRVTFSDMKRCASYSGSGLPPFELDVRSVNNHYPFGMQQPGRCWQDAAWGSYRYGFNGMERDDELKGEGNSLDFGARFYDPRVGRFLSIDPKFVDYPFYSPYLYAANNPSIFKDENGEGPSWWNRIVRGAKKIAGFFKYGEFVTEGERTYLQQKKAFEIEYDRACKRESEKRKDPNYTPKSEIAIYFKAHNKSPDPDFQSAQIQPADWDPAIAFDNWLNSDSENVQEAAAKIALNFIYSVVEDPYKAVTGTTGAGENVNGNDRTAAFATSIPISGFISKSTKSLRVIKVTGKRLIDRFIDFAKKTRGRFTGADHMQQRWDAFRANEEILNVKGSVKKLETPIQSIGETNEHLNENEGNEGNEGGG